MIRNKNEQIKIGMSLKIGYVGYVKYLFLKNVYITVSKIYAFIIWRQSSLDKFFPIAKTRFHQSSM